MYVSQPAYPNSTKSQTRRSPETTPKAGQKQYAVAPVQYTTAPVQYRTQSRVANQHQLVYQQTPGSYVSYPVTQQVRYQQQPRAVQQTVQSQVRYQQVQTVQSQAVQQPVQKFVKATNVMPSSGSTQYVYATNPNQNKVVLQPQTTNKIQYVQSRVAPTKYQIVQPQQRVVQSQRVQPRQQFQPRRQVQPRQQIVYVTQQQPVQQRQVRYVQAPVQTRQVPVKVQPSSTNGRNPAYYYQQVQPKTRYVVQNAPTYNYTTYV